MPLHLLGKKSWNVYNPANIERVRRDEAAAQAREEEAERRMDEYDAACRLARLRGEKAPSPPPDLVGDDKQQDRGGPSRGPKRRKLKGEDDTDRDIRVAREAAEQGREARDQLSNRKESQKTSDAPLMDHSGHIDLFPVDHKSMRKAEKNAEREAEEAKKKQALEDQYTMRFANAAGRDGISNPWYANASKSSDSAPRSGALEEVEEPGKDVWGNPDPRRRDRERTRLESSDPLAFMKRAQGQLKEAERDRRRWLAERQQEMLAMDSAAQSERRSERKSKQSARRCDDRDDMGELEGFDLNALPTGEKSAQENFHRPRSARHARDHGCRQSKSRSRSRDRDRRRRHRSRSRSRSPDRHRHRHRHRSHHRSKRSSSHGRRYDAEDSRRPSHRKDMQDT